jgi:WD40 repeat protein/energy-coupling factor transporter ATP-binding protein EcfA2
MAEVYKAYQPGLDRYVAVKVLHKHLAEEAGFVGRFEREAASVARLRHPNIVQVIDFDRHENQYYMVMEFIDGPTLRGQQEEREEPYSAEGAAYLISGVAGGLDYAHGRGVVHRDVKPGNIMFTGEGQVVLTDFGIAHIVGTTLYTESGGMLGTPAYMAPEQGRGEMGDGRSDIYSLGVVLYEMLTARLPYESDTPLGMIQQHVVGELPSPRTINADIPEGVEAVILQAMAVDPGDRYQKASEMAGALLEALGLQAERVGVYPGVREVVVEEEEEVDRPLPPCPYRGLFAFREEDAPYFYGREAFTDRLASEVEEKPLVGVLGPSGSGKSSVVFAGLLPHLRQAAGLRGAEGRAWAIVVCRPGPNPFYSLATALVPQLEGDVSDTARLVGTQELTIDLQEGRVTLSDVSNKILEEREQFGQLLLVVDQFEELFTLCQDSAERRRFIDTLLAGVEAGSPLRVILTLRADFLGQAASHRGFADAIQDAPLILGPMTRGELSQAVENPARKQGVGFEAGLVDRILDDVGDEPGNLPLLEFALTQLWEQQKTGGLSHEAYEAIGGVEGALARYADQVYERLSEAERDRARRVFTQMVMPGEGTEDTRRLAVRDELGEGDWELVRKLADARLLVTDLDVVSEIETVEVVHEALIQGWGHLQEWMREDRAFRIWQERLRAAMRGWEASERDEGALLRGGPLVEAESWLEERQAELSELEVIYIQESVILREHRQAVRNRRRRITVIGLAAGLIITLVLALVAYQQRQASQTQASILLAGQAETELANGYHDRAVLLALAALENLPYTAQAEHALGQAVSYNRALGTYPNHTTAVTSVAWSPDGEKVASSSSSENRVDVWDPATGEAILAIDMPTGITGNFQDMALHVQWTPDGERLLTLNGDRYRLGSQDYDLLLWDANTGELISSVEIPNQAEPESGEEGVSFVLYVTGAAGEISPRSGRLATLGGDDTAIIWDEDWGEPALHLSGHTQDVNSVDWSPDETMLATASLDGTAIIWDAETGEALYTMTGHEGWVNLALWSPDGSSLATAGEDGTLRIWDTSNGELVRTIDTPGAVSSLAWAPNSVRIVSGHEDGTLRIWEVATGRLLEPLRGLEGLVTDLKWSPVDDRLVSADGNGNVRVWNVAPSTAWRLYPPQAERGGDWSVQGIDWSIDGRSLVLAGGNPLDNSEPPSFEIWDVQANQLTMQNLGDELNYHGGFADFSPDDRLILYTGFESFPGFEGADIAYVFDARSGELVRTFTPQDIDLVRSVAWSPDGSQVATGLRLYETFMCKTLIWDYETGELIASLAIPSEYEYDEPVYLEWSPDGSKFSVTCMDGYVFDAHTWELLYTVQHEAPAAVFMTAWSPDGTRLLTGSGDDEMGAKDNTIRVWDGETGEEQLVISGHTKSVWPGSWSPNGERVATFSNDGTVRVWDASTGDELLTISIPLLYGGTALWSPDGEHIAIAGLDSLISAWRVWQSTEELIDYAKECCTFRELTTAEQAQFGLTE